VNRISIEHLRERLDYDPETGVLRWKIYRSPKYPAGSVANGYLRKRDNQYVFNINDTTILGKELCFAVFYGKWPCRRVIQKDGDPCNFKIINLMEETVRDWEARQRRPVGKSGYRGVTKQPNGKYRVYVCKGSKLIYGGCYSIAEKAAQVYDELAIKYLGSSAITNRSLGLLK
jgi:hypothetical protein